MRLPSIAIVSVATALAGCGESGPSDRDRVHETIEAFGAASASKDYQKLCDDLLAPKLIEQVESAGLPCEVAMREGLGEVEAPKLTIGDITVTGDEATARVQSTAAGQEPSTDTMHLVRVKDGTWRISALS